MIKCPVQIATRSTVKPIQIPNILTSVCKFKVSVFAGHNHGHHTRRSPQDRQEADEEVHPPPKRSLWEGQAQLAQTQGYRQQGSQAFQGNVQDAQHWLRIQQDHQTHAAQRFQKGLGQQP